jgi:2-polyprenyl-6-methoxyphenol hydroxylase-like FAD-dependent oxidoreductase
VPRADARIFDRINATGRPGSRPGLLGRAVVLGGSVAGLLAARVLAEHAESVVVIERDDVLTAGAARAGVPQGSQIHVLLPAGRAQLDRWFPGFSEEASAAGVFVVDAGVRRSYLDGRRRVLGSDVDMYSASRPFLEKLIRDRTLQVPNIKLISGRVTGLEFDGDAVTAVHHESAEGPGTETADFVVDAMGRASRLGDWLEQGAWEKPPMTRMTININYATAWFRRAESRPETAAVLAICSARRGGDLGGALFTAVEGDRWMAMMGGFGECRPGRTNEDFLRRLRDDFPAEFRQVADSEMLGDVHTYRQADSRRRDFHALQRFPARLIAVGDAVSSFNPIYGQGMASATLHASCLEMFLSGRPDLAQPAREFFALQKVVVDAAWGMSTSADLSRPSVPGARPRGHRFTSWLGDRIQRATVTDAAVARRFDDVTQMRSHPTLLVTPGVVLRALRAR